MDEVTPADAFADRVKAIIAENAELAGYSMDRLIDQGNGKACKNGRCFLQYSYRGRKSIAEREVIYG